MRHDQLGFIGSDRAYAAGMNLPVPVGMFMPQMPPQFQNISMGTFCKSVLSKLVNHMQLIQFVGPSYFCANQEASFKELDLNLGRGGMGRGGGRGRGGRNKPPRYSNQMQSANSQFSQNMMYSQHSQVSVV